MDKKCRIAIVTTWFPPEKGVAVNRMEAFAQYLSNDYEVHVFTLGDTDRSIQLNKYTVYYQTSNAFFNKWKHQTKDSWLRHQLISGFNVVSAFFGISTLGKWRKSTTKKLKEIHQKIHFDLIISSYAPVEAHLVVIDLFKSLPRIPWIADMRDEMSNNHFIDKKTKRRMRVFESLINDYATAVTSVSAPILDDFKLLMPKVNYFEEIRNGYNHDFVPETKLNNSTTYTIAYVGTFYGDRKPDRFFQALEQLLQKQSIDIQIKIVGSHENFTIPTSLKKRVECLPQLGYKEAIQLMATMDANLLIHPTTPQKGIYTGKLFDYISVRKPVIALVDPTDVAAQLIREFDCGYVADLADIQGIEHCLFEAYQDKVNGTIKMASQENALSLHRKEQIKKLSRLIVKIN